MILRPKPLSHGAVAVLLATALACGGAPTDSEDESAPPSDASEAQAPSVDLTDAGSIRGLVRYAGPDPDAPIDFAADPMCAELHDGPVTTQQVVGDAGRLGNVFVYVRSGLEGERFPVPAEAATVSQKGCIYRPHVIGLMVGQTLVIRNDDPTLHNVHAEPEANRAFNQGQPFPGMELERTFSEPELLIPVKCDVHPWMRAWVSVVEHPYFAVTGTDGTFAIERLPPGEYTLEAVHETLGKRTVSARVPARGEVSVELDFGGTAG